MDFTYDFEEDNFLKTAGGPNITNWDTYVFIVRVPVATFVLDTVRAWRSAFICKYLFYQLNLSR